MGHPDLPEASRPRGKPRGYRLVLLKLIIKGLYPLLLLNILFYHITNLYFLLFKCLASCRGAALMRRRRFIFVSPRVLPRSGLLPGVCADMVFVPRRGSLRRTCIPLVYAEMPSGQQVMVAPRPWVGTTPWYQPTANENKAPPAHQMPSGHIRHGLKLIVLY